MGNRIVVLPRYYDFWWLLLMSLRRKGVGDQETLRAKRDKLYFYHDITPIPTTVLVPKVKL